MFPIYGLSAPLAKGFRYVFLPVRWSFYLAGAIVMVAGIYSLITGNSFVGSGQGRIVSFLSHALVAALLFATTLTPRLFPVILIFGCIGLFNSVPEWFSSQAYTTLPWWRWLVFLLSADMIIAGVLQAVIVIFVLDLSPEEKEKMRMRRRAGWRLWWWR